MHQRAFQLQKIRRLITNWGEPFVVRVMMRNEFNEPNGEFVDKNLLGVFHEISSAATVEKVTTESTTYRRRATPAILGLWEDFMGIHHEDLIQFNGVVYRISKLTNLGEANLIMDISLEEVLY